MNIRTLLLFIALLVAAAGSWFLAGDRKPAETLGTIEADERKGYYILDAKLRGIGESGKYLYLLDADEASEDQERGVIELTAVSLSYESDTEIPWDLKADSGQISTLDNSVVLRGNVIATSDHSNLKTVLETEELSFDPQSYTVRSDKRVTLRVGSRAISATGMLAFLNEDRIEFTSNVSGKFLP